MKIVELTANLSIPITNEEADLLKKFEDHNSVTKSTLDEREQLIANNLTVKDVLRRNNNQGNIVYTKQIK